MENIKLTPKRKEIVSLMNFDSIMSVLRYYPYRYEHYKLEKLSFSMHDKKITFQGKIVSKVKIDRIAKGRMKTSFIIDNGAQSLNVIMFNTFANKSFLYEGASIVVSGKYNSLRNELSVSTFFMGTLEKEKFVSMYSLPSTIKDHTYRQFVNYIYDYAITNSLIKNEIPEEFIKQYKLIDLKDALYNIHNPSNEEDLRQDYRHLKYEEFLSFCLLGSLKRKVYSEGSGEKNKEIDFQYVNDFIELLPFKLTSDQIQAVREIIIDMNKKELMYRLLQGDVGTGKTIVAAISLFGNYLRNKIGAFMVPTDSLARQQYEYLDKLYSKFNIKVGLLIGTLSIKEKNIIKDKLKNGDIDIVVGTHALFSNDVIYSSLGLAIIDEQHRFGVKQRNELISKDDNCDLLLMSATPIPRTLALSIYGDLDITSLTNFPSKERKVVTKVVSEKSPEIFSVINDCITSNRQVFIVSNKIKGIEDSFSSAESIFEKYSLLYKDNVQLLHGKMKSEEKASILNDFINKKFLILVSTTVIELGINVLSAGAIIIYGSSHFGLASLHQLRGRVGRDGSEAYCLLVSDNLDDERLKFLENSNDGSMIAELDMKLRGPGDTIGSAQSGFPTFSCLNIVDDFKMFECARDDSYKILSNLNNGEYKRFYDDVFNKLQNEKDITLFD